MIAFGGALVGVFLFIATGVPLSAHAAEGFTPYVGYGFFLAAGLLFSSTMVTAGMTADGPVLVVHNFFTEWAIPVGLITDVDGDNGLVVTADGRAYDCWGYGGSLIQAFHPSPRYRRAASAIASWARSFGPTDEQPPERIRLRFRRWLLTATPVCVAAGLSYTSLVWLLAAPLRTLLHIPPP
jgi:hypothetical protein